MMVLNLEDDERLLAKYIVDRALRHARSRLDPDIDDAAVRVLESISTKYAVAHSRPHVAACWLNTLNALESGVVPSIYDAALSLGRALGLDHLCVPVRLLLAAPASTMNPFKTVYDLNLDPVCAAEVRACLHNDRTVASLDPEDTLRARVEIDAGGGVHAYIRDRDLLDEEMWVCIDTSTDASTTLMSMLVTALTRATPSTTDSDGVRRLSIDISA